MKPHQFSAREIREEGPSLPDEFIRRVLGNPKSGPKAVVQARSSAELLEADREAVRWEAEQERMRTGHA